MEETLQQTNLKSGLAEWARQGGIGISDFAARMNYGYQSAWNLLRGSAPVTVEALGRFVLAYGPEETGRLLELSGYPKS